METVILAGKVCSGTFIRKFLQKMSGLCIFEALNPERPDKSIYSLSKSRYSDLNCCKRGVLSFSFRQFLTNLPAFEGEAGRFAMKGKGAGRWPFHAWIDASAPLQA